MVIVTDFGADVQSYVAHFAELVFPRPAVCPHCELGGSLTGHGFYERQPRDWERDYVIRIKRWYCTACHLTTSLLPSFMLRCRHYLLSVIQTVVVARYEQQHSWTQIARQAQARGLPTARTLMRWCRAFAQQAARWWAAVQQTLAQQDAASPVLDPLGEAAGPRDVPAALLHASVHLLAWAKTRWAEVRSYGLTERLRFLWHWGWGQGLGRLI